VSARVFISYRREDTAAAAGRVYDHLCQALSPANVFMDVSAIRGGEDFERKMLSELERSDTVLVFIGKKWLDVQSGEGRPRIWEDRDYVRTEVRVALNREILVIPILVDGALMPRSNLLPDDVGGIARRNAMLLRHESFAEDVEGIVRAILGLPEKERPWNRRGTIRAKLVYSAAGLLLAAVLMAIGALLHLWILARPLSASIGDPATSLLLIVSAALRVAGGLGYEARRRKRSL
jgi:TIR domain-containing protein